MPDARYHRDRQRLGAGPIEHGGQRHDVVLLAVDHDGVGRHVGDLETPDRRADQHQPVGVGGRAEPRGGGGGGVAAEREAG